MVRIITIEREYGSGGAEIAKELAARLGWRLWDQLLMQEIARLAHATEAEVIDIHTRATYRVFMLGFMPGFAYMGLVDSRIAVPRRETPRVRVPRGSVCLAGVQTSIHPVEAPSGWHLIGRTPVRPFDPSRDDPFLMKPADQVQFYSIDRDEFDRLDARQHATLR